MQLIYRHGRRSDSRRSATGFTSHTVMVLVLLAIAWGSSFLFIKSSLDGGLAPAALIFIRTAVAAAALWCVVGVRSLMGRSHREQQDEQTRVDERLRMSIAWSDQIMVGLLGLAPMALVVFGEQFVSSGVAGIVNASDPLWTALLLSLIARKLDRDPRRWLGIIVGFGGVMVVMTGQAGGLKIDGQVIGLLAVLMSAAMYSALGVFVSLRLSAKSSLYVTTVGMTWSAVFAAPFAFPTLARGDLPQTAVLNAVALGLIGGACGFGLFYYLLSKVGATRSAFVVYLMPIVAVLLGVVVRQEPITIAILAGMILVVSGIGVANQADDGFEQALADQQRGEEAQRRLHGARIEHELARTFNPMIETIDRIQSSAHAAAAAWRELRIAPMPWDSIAARDADLSDAQARVMAESRRALDVLRTAAEATSDPTILEALLLRAEVEVAAAERLLASMREVAEHPVAAHPHHDLPTPTGAHAFDGCFDAIDAVEEIAAARVAAAPAYPAAATWDVVPAPYVTQRAPQTAPQLRIVHNTESLPHAA